MVPAMHAFPCGRIINISIVSLVAIADAKSELAWEYVGPQGLVLKQVKPILAPRTLHEVFSLPFARVLTCGASWNQSVTLYSVYEYDIPYSCKLLKCESSNLLLWYLLTDVKNHAIQVYLIMACPETTMANQAKNVTVQSRSIK